MPKTPSKSAVIYLRVTPDVKKAFDKRAESYGKPSEALRELVLAYIDGRVVVTPRPL